MMIKDVALQYQQQSVTCQNCVIISFGIADAVGTNLFINEIFNSNVNVTEVFLERGSFLRLFI